MGFLKACGGRKPEEWRELTSNQYSGLPANCMSRGRKVCDTNSRPIWAWNRTARSFPVISAERENKYTTVTSPLSCHRTSTRLGFRSLLLSRFKTETFLSSLAKFHRNGGGTS